MLLALLAAFAVAQDSGRAYSGRARQLDVAVPRLEAEAAVDGILDEAAWSRAARLTGFSQYQPVDGQPADEATEVLVWYAPDAIWFGVRARERHGDVVRATRANRDNIGSEDQVQILLDTYNDRRVAFLFGVNPLGVQQDGTRSDQFGGGAGGRSGGGGGVGINPLEGNVDLNPDYVFESRGRLVEGGYEVEIRIPFKSLRYQEGAEQTWGINVLRRVQHSGFQDTWAPAVRANASFLGQGGTLAGLRDLRRGLVLELSPTLTQRVDGAAGAAGWRYDGWSQLGGDVRWGVTQNLSVNGTVLPDFSQVEADVGQILLNERFALFLPEKRPFFLDGLELFDTPNQLIYTRRIVDPDAGVKVAGKVNGTNLGALIALDGRSQSAGSDRPFVGALRMRRDLGRNSTVGAVLTDREDGARSGRLAGLDARIYHSRLYFLEFQAVQSWTDDGALARRGPLFSATWDRTGRTWGFNYGVSAIAPGFDAAVGFVNRTGVISAHAFNRLTGYGAPGALVQTFGSFFFVQRVYDYTYPAAGAIEGGIGASPSATLRGGWGLGGNIGRNFYRYAAGDYADYQVETTLPASPPGQRDTVAFAVPGGDGGQVSASLRVTTPTYRLFTATVSGGAGATPIFREAAPGRFVQLSAALDMRPLSALRLSAQVSRLAITRSRDDSRFSTETIPRLKVEYQASRAVFFRFVGQYTARERAALTDRNGDPILVNGALQPRATENEFRADLLASYRPIPGTLVYLGYGSTLNETDAFRFRDLRRTRDGFFGKVSYLFRL